MSLAPPWVVFWDGGRPVAILPAGRPGEVCRVDHLPAERVERIVRLANQLYDEVLAARLQGIEIALADLRKLIEKEASE